MLESLTTSDTLLAYTDMPHGWEWLQSFANNGQAVVLKSGANRHLFVPEGRTAESVWNDVLEEAKVKGV